MNKINPETRWTKNQLVEYDADDKDPIKFDLCGALAYTLLDLNKQLPKRRIEDVIVGLTADDDLQSMFNIFVNLYEEIFGEIEDEHDAPDLIENKLGPDTFMLSARHEIDYLNEQYSWQLPIGDYDTLGGLILSYTEDFPKEGDRISIPPFTFTVQSTEDNRIDMVKVEVDPASKPE